MKRALIALFVLCFTVLLSYQIELKENQVWWPGELWNGVWCSVSVKDSAGNFVRNLKLEDFKIIEKAYGKNGELLEEKPADFQGSTHYNFGGNGFWEKSINSDKLDIAFFIDGTGSMSKYTDSIAEQLHGFLDRLIKTGTDFRIFISMYGAQDRPGWTITSYTNRFFGPTMIDEIRKAIDDIDTGGEWWDLSWGYDVFLWSLNLDWREDARKIVVIITDVYTDSVYGPNWYFSAGCVSSMSAVDLAIKETGIQLYYCQPEEKQMAETELSENYSDKVNIKVKENNFDRLEKRNPLVKKLSWPFNQQEIELKNLPVVDSRYYFAWVSDWNKYTFTFISRVDVTLSIAQTGESVSFSFYPLKNPDGTKANESVRNVKFTLKDESGLSMLGQNNVWIYFYKVMGDLDRMDIIGAMHQISDKNGIVSMGSVTPGKYYYILTAAGFSDLLAYHYDILSYTARGWVEISKEGVKPDQITAYTCPKDAEIYRMLGLLEELENLDISTAKLKALAHDAREWLEEIKKDGITLVELEAIKRFNIGIGAMINCAGYADVIQNRTIEDFVQIVQKMTDMVRTARKVAEEVESVMPTLLKATNLFIDIITGNWSGVAANLTIQEVVDKFVNYIKNELVDDIIKTVETKLLDVLNHPEEILDYFHIYVENWVKQQLRPDQITQNVFNFVNGQLVYNNFTSDLEEQARKLLLNSKELVQENYEKYWDYDKRSGLMRTDFYETRKQLMGDLFDKSYKALRDQEAIDDWESVLILFRETIPMIVEFIELFEVRYPELSEVKKSLKTLYSVLDAIGTLTRTYEMALKVNHLQDLQSRVRQLADSVYKNK